ncbi:beta-hexosaminidase, partial [Escherichia coli]|nr:beta-hexosaminidase [Escherichia coli]
MLFPRAAAIAEMGWTPRQRRSFAGFVPRVDAQMARWRRGGVEVADSGFAVGFTLGGTRGAALREGRARLSLASQIRYGTI